MAETKRVVVKRVGRYWDIFVDGELVEGGFFSKEAAHEAALEYMKSQK